MNKETINTNENGEVDFDFGFDNFRAMGFTYSGVVKQCRIQQPEKAEYSFIDKKTGKTITKQAKPQLVVLIEPTDHVTKSGNPYPEYLPLTHNVRSKLGIFVEGLKNLGISLGANPEKIEGLEFEWEVKEVDFGGNEPTRVNVPIAQVDALSKTALGQAAPAVSAARSGLSADEKSELAIVLSGATKDTSLASVARSTFGGNPAVIAGVADGSLIQTLQNEGFLTVDNGQYLAAA